MSIWFEANGLNLNSEKTQNVIYSLKSIEQAQNSCEESS